MRRYVTGIVGLIGVLVLAGCGGSGGGDGKDGGETGASLPLTGDGVGHLEMVVGEIEIARADKATSSSVGGTIEVNNLEAPFEVQEGDTIKTGPDERVKITLNDGTQITVGPNSSFTFDEFTNKSGTQSGSLGISGTGTMKALTGAIKNATYRMDSSCGSFALAQQKTMTIGIRGTEFAAYSQTCTADPEVAVMDGKVYAQLLNGYSEALGSEAEIAKGNMLDENGNVVATTPAMEEKIEGDLEATDGAKWYRYDLARYWFPEIGGVYNFRWQGVPGAVYAREYQVGSTSVSERDMAYESYGVIRYGTMLRYSISGSKITVNDGYGSLSAPRYVKSGDVVFENGDFGCKVVGHMWNHETTDHAYTDVLKLKCSYQEGGEQYRARNVGLVQMQGVVGGILERI